MAKRRRKRQQHIAKYEIAGLLLICASALAFADLGWMGRSLDSLFMFTTGNWHWLLGIYIAYLAVVMMIRRGPVVWTKRQIGILLVFVLLLTWSQLNLFTSVASDYGHADRQMWTVTMRGVSTLRETAFATSVPSTTGSAMITESAGGGAVGYVLFSASHYLFDTAGTLVVLVVIGLVSIALLTNRSVFAMIASIRRFAVEELDRLWEALSAARTRFKENQEQKKSNRVTTDSKKTAQKQMSVVTDRTDAVSNGTDVDAVDPGETNSIPIVIHNSVDTVEQTNTPGFVVEHGQDAQMKIRFLDKGKQGGQSKAKEPPFELIDSHKGTLGDSSDNNYQLPSLNMLEASSASRGIDQREIHANIRTLEKTLETFGVKATVINASSGPTVTRYELQPATGVRVKKIVDLQNDLQLAMAAGGIRMEAPIPGKSAVGIEVPNKEVGVVSLREVLQSSEFAQSDTKLTIGLGRDVSGNSIVGDLGRMPHLLVAGATGSGKSVCVNGIIASILFKAKPDEVKFIMIDPKVVELNVYNGIPHMMAPVVTDPRRAAQALKKVVAEMESRYEVFAQNGVKDLAHYNEVMRQSGEESLPYIVVIVDELADLMMVASSDVEEAICRIAQKARASGIHLIVATQRPSVDVITGTIKANIPSRIAFAVSSSADSRTILDTVGAEKLLGRGDMLYLPVGAAKSIRVQGAFISESDVERLVQFVKGQQVAEYTVDLSGYSDTEIDEPNDVDSLFNDAVTLVVEAGQASASILQRRLSVGYNRAAKLIEAMEQKGYVGPFQGSRPREVLLSKEAWLTAKHG